MRAATVLGQVDSKFIACILQSGVLVLVDQHAADERIRVERFLRRLCESYVMRCTGEEDAKDGRVQLDEPLPVLLTNREATSLAKDQRFSDAFKRWGIEVDAYIEEDVWAEQHVGKEYVQVWVHTVPEVIADKVRVYFSCTLRMYLLTLRAIAAAARERTARLHQSVPRHTRERGRATHIHEERSLERSLAALPAASCRPGQLEGLQR